MDPIGPAISALEQATGVLLAGGGVLAVLIQLVLLVWWPLWSLWLFVAASACALALLANGFIYTAITSVGLTVGWSMSLLLALAAVVLSQSDPNRRDRTLLVLGAVVGLLATAVTAVQVLNPAQPVFATPGACIDSPVTHSAVTVRTGDAGQNARSGPGASYPVQRRYDARCLIGVDAYCLGTPVLDSASLLWDYRWFRPRFSRTYLPAALVFETAGTDISLGASPESDCPGARANPAFEGTPKLSLGNGGKTIGGSFTVIGSTMVGFASAVGDGKHLRIGQLGGRVRHSDSIALPDGTSSPGDSADVSFAADTGKLTAADETSEWSGRLFAAVPCVAANVPSYGEALFYSANAKSVGAGYRRPASDFVPPSDQATLSPPTIEARLLAAACALNR